MLQTRFENEQFETLPLIYPGHRSRNDYITTDRPDSAQLVDLHIYVIPKSVWKNIQHLAQNQAMDDAVSAGFIRVSPERKLRDLRGSIENLCGKENFFPRDFIFLRSVGRCLTRVKPSQENELKVKNYRPPQTLASEIYLLEGRHEDYGNISSASPALSSASYLFGTRRQFRFNADEFSHDSSRITYGKPLRTDKEFPPIHSDHMTYRRSSSKRKTGSQSTQLNSDLDEFSPSTPIVTNITPRELSKLKEEQERLRRRQEDLERMRRAMEEKRFESQREREEKEREQRRREEKERVEREEHERQRIEKERIERERQEQAVERRRQRRQEKADIERRRQEKLELAATKIQASFRGFQERQIFRQRQKNLLKNLSQKSDINDDELSDGSDIRSGSSIGSTTDFDSSSSRPETRTMKLKSSEILRSSSSSFLSRKFRSKKPLFHSKTEDLSNKDDLHLDEKIRATTVTKIRHSDDDIRPISTSEDETYEVKRREADVKRQRHLEDEKRKAKEFDDHQRRESEKVKQREDVESLRERLEKLRRERIQQERFRDEVIKQLRHVHQRITQRRKEARDMWKKKYFQEKKKTSSLEDRVAQLKGDVEFYHGKTMQIIENENKQPGSAKDTELRNLLVQITRTQHEKENIRRQVDLAKLRLTTDLKLRNQAEGECGLLKHELTQAKMNLNHIKNRQTTI